MTLKHEALRQGLDIVEVRPSLNHERGAVGFRLRPIIDDHVRTISASFNLATAMNIVCRQVRAQMRSDMLRALLDDDEEIDLMGRGVTSDEAYEMCERMATRLMEKAAKYRGGVIE